MRRPKRKEAGFEGELPPKKRQDNLTGPPPLKKVPSKKRTPVPKSSPKKTFEMRSMTFLLTFPQWEGTDTLEELKQKLLKFWEDRNKEVKEAIICIENHGPKEDDEIKSHAQHEDPGRHIHMCFKLDKPHPVRRADFFDDLGGKHGDIQTCRNYKACQIYCAKDNNYITHNVDIDAVVKSTKSKKGVKHETVANFIKKKERTMLEVDSKYPGYMIQHQRKVSDYIKLQYSFKDTTTEFPGIGNVIGRSPCIVELVSWLNNNLPPKERPFKQKQLWLWGAPNMGKTTLRMDLSKWFIPYDVVVDEDKWWSGLDHSKQIAFFEEFSGTKTLSAMKSFLDGSPMSIAVKGETMPFRKTKNIPCIILSNKHPDEVYAEARTKSEMAYQGLIERLKIIEVTEFITIPWNKPKEQQQPEVVTGPSIDEDEKDEVDSINEQENMDSSSDEVVPASPKPVSRAKTLYGKDLEQQLLCDEVLIDGSQSDPEEHNNPPDPYEVGIQEDPYNEEVLSSYDSDDSYLTKQEKLFNKVAKPVKRRKEITKRNNK